MKSPVRYVVITPVRNEVRNLPRTIESFVGQTIRPAAWVIVDDGSTDGTSAIADEAAAKIDWIKVIHRKDRGFRQPGTGVVEAINEALEVTQSGEWDFFAKLDGDLAFAPDYMEACLAEFGKSPRLGIGGGVICREADGELVVESKGDPAFHVRGATKIYRRECWQQLGGLMKAPGWDTIDEVKANFLGWETRTFPQIKIHQLKDTGSADGKWRNWVKNGLANYITGYHPLFMAVKCARRVFRRPYGIAAGALAWGFLGGYLNRTPRVEHAELIRYLHEQQFRKLTFRPSIWG